MEIVPVAILPADTRGGERSVLFLGNAKLRGKIMLLAVCTSACSRDYRIAQDTLSVYPQIIWGGPQIN